VTSLNIAELPQPLDRSAVEAESGPRPVKAERLAMNEVRQGLVDWSLPDFKAVFDVR